MTPHNAYPAPEKGLRTRRVMELVGWLHRRGYGRLRLACSWEHAGPAPVWFGDIAPVSYIRRDHGALLAQEAMALYLSARDPSHDPQAGVRLLNDQPMFSSRRFGLPAYPWPNFLRQAPEQCVEEWLSRYPALAEAGRGEDKDYAEWYAEMLRVTGPTGLLAASVYWEALPGHMYVSCGPAGVEQVPLPPPGEA